MVVLRLVVRARHVREALLAARAVAHVDGEPAQLRVAVLVVARRADLGGWRSEPGAAREDEHDALGLVGRALDLLDGLRAVWNLLLRVRLGLRRLLRRIRAAAGERHDRQEECGSHSGRRTRNRTWSSEMPLNLRLPAASSTQSRPRRRGP